jgi:predicted GNAT family acetyltransferase/predicted double-glycine peptidase
VKGYKFSRTPSTIESGRLDVHHDGKNVGYIRIRPGKRKVRIKSLYVAPKYRGKGLAHELLKRVIDENKDKEISLGVDPFKDKPMTVKNLKELYSSHGFESVGRWEMVRKPMSKEAGGDIIGGLAGLLSRPFVGAARSQQIRNNIVGGITRNVNQPIENALHRSGVRNVISKAYQVGTRPVPGPLGKKVIPFVGQPYMPHPEQRRAYGNWRADDIVHTIANNPEAGLALAAPAISPVMAAFPTTSTYLGAKGLAGRALGMKKEAAVAPYQQKTDWTCSAACFKAVLNHFGIDVSEDQAVELIGTRPGRGAECDEIVNAARAMSLDSFEYSFDSIEQAKILIDQDIPIICDIQSFNHPGKGHYVVLTKIDPDSVELMDPNTPGNIRTISRAEMETRWWDRAMRPPHNLMTKWAVIILPRD